MQCVFLAVFVNANIPAFSIDHNVNSSANDRDAIFGIMHAGEPLN